MHLYPWFPSSLPIMVVYSLTSPRVQLDLRLNRLGPEGAAVLAPAIAVCASLTKMLVGGNQLGDEGTTILCDALRESKVTKVQVLDLYGNDIGPDGAKAIAALCTVCASMTQADLEYNKLGDEAKAALRKAVEGRLGFELNL